eukprot:Pgem_evm1s975
MCKPYILAALMVPLACLTFYFYHFLGFSTIGTLHYHDNCFLMGHTNHTGKDILHGSEDITHYRNGIMLVSSGDLYNTLGGEEAAPGGIFAFDLKSNPPSYYKLTISNAPSQIPLHPHGTDDHLELVYLRDIKSKLFENGNINDVIEGASEGELYVTQWLQYPVPAAGLRHPVNLEERINIFKQDVAQMVYPGSHVFHCTFSSVATVDAQCSVTGKGMYSANGITKDPQSSRIFVNDAIAKKVIVYNRQSNGKLVVQNTISLEFHVDNLEFDQDSNTIYAGNVPLPYLCLLAPKTVNVPGGISTLSLDSESGNKSCIVNNSVVMHDGLKLSHISSGYVWNNVAILGSPFSDVIVPGGIPTLSLDSESGNKCCIVNHSVVMHDGLKLSHISSGCVLNNFAILGSPFSDGVSICYI